MSKGGPSVAGPPKHGRTEMTGAFDNITPDNEKFVDRRADSPGRSLEVLDLDAEDFAKGYFDGFEYEIGAISVDDKAGTATADVKFKMKSIAITTLGSLAALSLPADGDTASVERLAEPTDIYTADDINAAFDAAESKAASDFRGRALEELRHDARAEPMHLDEILEDCAPRMARNTDWSADECASLLGSVLPTLRRWRKDD